jgi:hypothetical protein
VSISNAEARKDFHGRDLLESLVAGSSKSAGDLVPLDASVANVAHP